MNTSGESVASSTLAGSGSSGYVSCIKVDGRPILPPIMNESVRAEMRRYRELAKRVESNLRFKKQPRPAVFPLNKTVTLDSASDFNSFSSSGTDVSETASEKVPLASGGGEGRINYDDHFLVKKPMEEPTVLSCIEEISERSEESSVKSEMRRSETYTKTPDGTFFVKDEEDDDKVDNGEDPLTDEEDHKSEAMSLVSIDEKISRDDIGSDSDFSVENYPPDGGRSGRSSTETFIIEKHATSDTENNNESHHEYSEPKYFFSPTRGEGDTSIIFNAEKGPNTVKSRKFFQSPTSPGEVVLSEASMVTSISSSTTSTTESGSNASHDVTGSSFHTPKSTVSSKSGVVRKFYFSSPDTSPPQVSARSDIDSVNSHLTETSVSVSVAASTPPPKLLTPTNTNILHDEFLKSPKRPEKYSTSPGIRMSPTKIPGRIPDSREKPLRSPALGRRKSPEVYCTPANQFNFTFTKSTPTTPKGQNHLQSSSISHDDFIVSGAAMIPQKTPTQNPPSEPKTVKSAPAKAHGPTINPQSASTTFIRSPVQATATIGQSQILGRVNLSTLQMAMMNLSPNVFRNPPDARSPLLKGVVYMDPLFRPKKELRIPPQASEPAMQPKFARISAIAKGFLVRRLLRTEKLQMIIQTIRDTVEMVLKLYEEVPELKIRGWKGVKSEDADLCRRLFQQLTGACGSFHDVFFKLTTTQRMAIIANDREKRRAKELKSYLSRSESFHGSRSKNSRWNKTGPNSKRKITTATAKCLERRASVLS